MHPGSLTYRCAQRGRSCPQSAGLHRRCTLAPHPPNRVSVTTRSYTFQVFTFGTSIPRNLNRLIDLKQSVTLTGLGTVGFDDAVRGMQTIYQVFSNHVSRAGSHLRTWTPGRDGQDLTLTFANHYLTSNRDVGNETSTDLSVIDPFNILQPLIKNEVHTADNVVEYWERRGKDDRYVTHTTP